MIWVYVDLRHGDVAQVWHIYLYKSLMMHIIKFKFEGQIVLEKKDWRPDITGASV